MKSKGFSLINLVVGIAVAGGLTVVATPIYHTYIAKSQAAEADRLINTERIHVFSNMQRGSCLSGNTPSPQEGRYGTLALSGNFKAKSGKSCPSGCEITYTFGANTNKLIAGKKVVVNVLMDGGVTKNNKTTLQDKFWASDITRADAVVVGDNCTALAVETPTFTAGAAPAGNEIGATAPESGGGSGGVIPPTTPTTPVTPPPVTPPPVTPPPGEVTPPELPSDCPKYTGYMTCHQDTGYINCRIYTDSSRKVVGGVVGGGYPVSTLLLATAQRTATFAFNNGRCPQTTEEVADTSLGGARVSCSLVKPFKLQLVDRCK